MIDYYTVEFGKTGDEFRTVWYVFAITTIVSFVGFIGFC